MGCRLAGRAWGPEAMAHWWSFGSGKGVDVAVVRPQDADAEEEKCAHRGNCATARLTSGAPFDEAHRRPPDGAITHRKAEAPRLPVRNFWPIEHAGGTPCCRSTHHVGGGRPRACRWGLRPSPWCSWCLIYNARSSPRSQGHGLAYLETRRTRGPLRKYHHWYLVRIFSIDTSLVPRVLGPSVA